MKKIFLLGVLSFFVFSGFSQTNKFKEVPINKPLLDNKPVHWGFTFGVNKSYFSILKNDSFFNVDSSNNLVAIEGKSYPGFYLGPVFNVRLGKFFDLRFLIDISFTQRTLDYYFAESADTNAAVNITSIKLPSTFIEAPVLLKYKGARIENMRPYVILGASPKYDLASLRKVNEDQPYLKIAPFDVYMEIGPGMDFYFPYFKLSVELKYSNGFFNVLEQDNSIYAKPLDGLKSNSFMLSFHFEG